MNIDKRIEIAWEKYAVTKYGSHTVKTEGMSGELSGRGYQDRKEDFIAGDKNGQIEALNKLNTKIFDDALDMVQLAEYIDTELKKMGE